MFLFFLKKTADLISPKLVKIFRALLTSESFSELWRISNVSPIPKGGTPSQFPFEYRLISITPVISTIFEKLIVKRLYKSGNAELSLVLERVLVQQMLSLLLTHLFNVFKEFLTNQKQRATVDNKFSQIKASSVWSSTRKFPWATFIYIIYCRYVE